LPAAPDSSFGKDFLVYNRQPAPQPIPEVSSGCDTRY
jgi:hypothetical protein